MLQSEDDVLHEYQMSPKIAQGVVLGPKYVMLYYGRRLQSCNPDEMLLLYHIPYI